MKIPASQVVSHMQALLLRQQLEEAKRPEPEVEIPVGEKEKIRVPVSQAPYMLQTQWAQERRREAERQLEQLQAAYNELRKELSPERIAEKAEAMGYVRRGSPAYDFVSKFQEDFEQKVDRLLSWLERRGPPGPAGRGPVYTPAERVERAERLGEAEEEVIRAAKKVVEEERGR